MAENEKTAPHSSVGADEGQSSQSLNTNILLSLKSSRKKDLRLSNYLLEQAAQLLELKRLVSIIWVLLKQTKTLQAHLPRTDLNGVLLMKIYPRFLALIYASISIQKKESWISYRVVHLAKVSPMQEKGLVLRTLVVRVFLMIGNSAAVLDLSISKWEMLFQLILRTIQPLKSKKPWRNYHNVELGIHK